MRSELCTPPPPPPPAGRGRGQLLLHLGRTANGLEMLHWCPFPTSDFRPHVLPTGANFIRMNLKIEENQFTMYQPFAQTFNIQMKVVLKVTTRPQKGF